MRRLFAIWLCLSWGCTGTRTGNPTNADVPVGAALARSDLPRDTKPTLSPQDAMTFGDDNRAFALALYGELGKQSGNLFVSPYSISTALAMAYAGAKAQTATEMASTLHFTLAQPTLHAAFNATNFALAARRNQLVETAPGNPPRGDGFQLSLANQAWGPMGAKFLDTYLDVLATNYGAGLFLLDFGNAERARGIINDWVADQTEQRVPELLPEHSLSPNTRLVLTNAVYFKASWIERFDPQLTASAQFHSENGDRDVSMMRYTGEAQYASVNGYQAVARRYLSPAVYMLLVLPPEGPFAAAASQFDAQLFAAVRNALSSYTVTLSLPRWEFESARKLKEPLQNLGMRAAFGDQADFSGITGRTGLHIDDVYHNAFVHVDEDGTEAAAATAVVFADGGVSQPVTVTFDRPFLFLIYDEPTGQILFLGHLTDPG